MTCHYIRPEPEEADFVARVNATLARLCDGAKVTVFRLADSSPLAAGKPYGLIMQLGSKRKTLTGESSFCHASEDDLVSMVTEWIATVGQGERWTTDERYA
jgi:hypothetical protein